MQVAPYYRLESKFILGTTGSGKSHFLETQILYWAENYTSQQLKFVLIDTTQCQFAPFTTLPHLVCPLIYSSKQAIKALEYLRDASISINKIAKVVIVIDELTNLLYENTDRTKQIIIALLNKGYILAFASSNSRAFTDLTIDNPVSKIAFHTATPQESLEFLGCVGAEKLKGAGDMLFKDAVNSEIQHLHSPFVGQKEISGKITRIASKQKRNYDKNLSRLLEEEQAFSKSDEFFDAMVLRTQELLKKHSSLSPTIVQTELSVGYSLAVKLINALNLSSTNQHIA